ncbi:MAG: glycosyl transferase family 2 [Halanaeroarchaeum sp.]
MDFTQERVATLHDYGDANPSMPTQRTALVVPMTDRDAGSLAADRFLSSLSTLSLARVVVPISAPRERIGSIVDWLDEYETPVEPLWCDGPAVEALLDESGLDGESGKGRDVWLGIGLADDAEIVALHDADVTTNGALDVRKLLAPLDGEVAFSKAYYARVENGRLYGRLFRLLYEPLVATLERAHDEPILSYLGAFRYALSGEFAMTADLARGMRVPRRWGLEVGTLGEAYDAAGVAGTAQVDLGRYEHDHRAVTGPTGLSQMAVGVAQTLLRAVEEHGVELDYGTLPGRYRDRADEFVRRYRADAVFNDMDFDAAAERDQVRSYATAIEAPGSADALPPWSEPPFEPSRLRRAVRDDLDRTQ